MTKPIAEDQLDGTVEYYPTVDGRAVGGVDIDDLSAIEALEAENEQLRRELRGAEFARQEYQAWYDAVRGYALVALQPFSSLWEDEGVSF